MTICEQITERFPVRKTAAQRKAFRQWVMGECARMGYTARIEENDKGRQQNIIVGDPEHAEVTFTAHYDTPSTICCRSCTSRATSPCTCFGRWG